MQLIQRFFDFYIFGNIHVAFATFSLVKITQKYYNIDDHVLPIFVFFATIIAYNFIRLYRMDEVKSWLYDWIEINKTALYIVSGFSFLILIYFGMELEFNTMLMLIPLSLLTLFYVVPLKGRMSLRTLSRVKLFLIAFCWASVTVLLPIINEALQLDKDVLITFIQRFLFVVVLTLSFDIRDLHFDSEDLKTVPQLIGVVNAKRLGLLLLMLFLGLNFLKENIDHQQISIEFFITIITLLFLIRSKEKQHKYYSAFFVESIPILWFIFVFYK